MVIELIGGCLGMFKEAGKRTDVYARGGHI